ncbi:hypothetical protein O3P69_004287 [Scylla paramamosain]|uniref:Uncharacterized protein n=1 Tax=Scylla paramamosain TaxID=85552 RepID=A0AAW0UG47_SCYPA
MASHGPYQQYRPGRGGGKAGRGGASVKNSRRRTDKAHLEDTWLLGTLSCGVLVSQWCRFRKTVLGLGLNVSRCHLRLLLLLLLMLYAPWRSLKQELCSSNIKSGVTLAWNHGMPTKCFFRTLKVATCLDHPAESCPVRVLVELTAARYMWEQGLSTVAVPGCRGPVGGRARRTMYHSLAHALTAAHVRNRPRVLVDDSRAQRRGAHEWQERVVARPEGRWGLDGHQGNKSNLTVMDLQTGHAGCPRKTDRRPPLPHPAAASHQRRSLCGKHSRPANVNQRIFFSETCENSGRGDVARMMKVFRDPWLSLEGAALAAAAVAAASGWVQEMREERVGKLCFIVIQVVVVVVVKL